MLLCQEEQLLQRIVKDDWHTALESVTSLELLEHAHEDRHHASVIPCSLQAPSSGQAGVHL